MTLLKHINSPADLKRLEPGPPRRPRAGDPGLPGDLRRQDRGHLGPNLGVVELTIALHRIFDSPRDTIVFDTGHQSYVHKLLTGRHDFSALKEEGRAVRLPQPRRVRGTTSSRTPTRPPRCPGRGHRQGAPARGRGRPHTVAIIGDGALTGAWPGRRSTTSPVDETLKLVIVVNDNTRSYAPTIGGMAQHLASMRATRRYEKMLDWGRGALNRTPVVGGPMYDTLHGVKKGLKGHRVPRRGMFEDLGIKYLGPVDGHDEQALEDALTLARDFGGPVIVHTFTEKGRGYDPAALDEGRPVARASASSTPRPVCRSRSAGASGPTSSTTRWCGLGAERPRHRRDHRGHAHPGRARRVREGVPRARLRRRHRRAARRDDGLGSGVRRSAPGRRGVRHVPQPGVRTSC